MYLLLHTTVYTQEHTVQVLKIKKRFLRKGGEDTFQKSKVINIHRMSTKKVNWAYKKHFGDVVDDDGATADGVEITEGKSARAISCIQNFDIFLTHTHTPTHTADMLTAVEFDQTGEYLAAGDRGGTCTNTHTRTHKHARIHKTPTTNDERQVASVSSKPRTRHRNWWLKRRHHSGHHQKRRRRQLWRIISSFM